MTQEKFVPDTVWNMDAYKDQIPKRGLDRLEHKLEANERLSRPVELKPNLTLTSLRTFALPDDMEIMKMGEQLRGEFGPRPEFEAATIGLLSDEADRKLGGPTILEARFRTVTEVGCEVDIKQLVVMGVDRGKAVMLADTTYEHGNLVTENNAEKLADMATEAHVALAKRRKVEVGAIDPIDAQRVVYGGQVSEAMGIVRDWARETRGIRGKKARAKAIGAYEDVKQMQTGGSFLSQEMQRVEEELHPSAPMKILLESIR